jgi:hypothetical protein
MFLNEKSTSKMQYNTAIMVCRVGKWADDVGSQRRISSDERVREVQLQLQEFKTSVMKEFMNLE